MAYKCAVCGKAPVSGGSYSHSNMRTKRSFKPNLQKQKVMLDGKAQTAYVCTVCIKSGRAARPTK
ncbi:50S ribosomal protein L28 [Candidatus Avelusimicrobium aviculae]|uniref:50S ribosomal protein L28 n=1 Tax=Candidatus Avelusimicrobium aviculae TaxID=3416206 RepID=UPI003D0DB121